MKYAERAARAIGAMALTLALAACGGGGGGGGGGLPMVGVGQNGAPPSEGGTNTADGAWLKLPGAMDFTIQPEDLPIFSFGFTVESTKTFEQPVNIAIIDAAGSILPNVQIQGRGLIYGVTVKVRPDLSPGIHSGKLELRVCFDLNPLVCAQPVSGSPWFVPYTFRVVDKTKYTFSAWNQVSTNAGYSDDYSLSQINDRLVVVEAAFYEDLIRTWTSDDLGVSWQQLEIPGPTRHVRHFALASQGSALYFSGGEEIAPYSKPTGGYSAEVWRFDGAAWQRRSAAAPFGGRAKHVMARVGSKLYVAGGVNGAGPLRDVWVSSDDGAAWSLSAAMLPEAVGQPGCMLAWKNQLLVIGDKLATSADGVRWQVQADPPPTFPKGTTQCAVLGDRLYVAPSSQFPIGSNTMSTTDLADWTVERRGPTGGFQAPGMATLNGRLIILDGSGTSQRSTYRTEP